MKKSRINYDFKQNDHSQQGADKALKAIFGKQLPNSVLDVGCGPGKWLKGLLTLGVTDLAGIDGIDMFSESDADIKKYFIPSDITEPIQLGRKFDVALCLEVAEHIDETFARNLIEILTDHSDTIYFSAASPKQPGQNHVNCRWPRYWQKLFNEKRFYCSDCVRWSIWDDKDIEPWYRQNIFLAKKSDSELTGEVVIPSVIHPDILDLILENSHIDCEMPWRWHASQLMKKIRRKLIGL